MSLYRSSVEAFVQVLESQSSLISLQDWQELEKLPSELPDDDEEIIEILESWLRTESHNQIFQAYNQNLESIISSLQSNDNEPDILIGGAKSPTPPNQPSQTSKELLENTIKKNSPLSDNLKSNKQP